MFISTTLDENLPAGDTSVALGFFDGIHQGHKQVLELAVAGREQGLIPCVFTFTRGPGVTKAEEGLIQSEAVKELLLSRMGMEYLFSPSFESFRGLSPKEFVEEVLIGRYRARRIVCGENFRFGKGAAAGVAELRALAAAHGVEVLAVPVLLDGGEPISSTRIRAALLSGDMPEARRLLGHPFTLVGEVVHGAKLGRTIGYPTTNQFFGPDQLVPKHGVYATISTIGGREYIGATNVGRKPTVEGQEVSAETYLVDFDRQIYGETVTLEFYHYLRGEQKFSSLEELGEAIGQNAREAVELCREFLK